MVRMRREPQDDYLHEVEAASNFNESRYYNLFDPGAGMGGWVRMGNRPNEGYAEMTVCLYLPDGRVGVQLQATEDRRPRSPRRRRPPLRGREAVRGAPHHVRRQGLRARRAARDGRPEECVQRQPARACTIDLTLEAVGRPWGGEPEWEEGDKKPDLDPEKMFARGHTEQHMAVTGTVTVGDERFDITDGLGLRDHSWGPRFWQNIWWYRWLTVNLGPELGFALTISGAEEDPDAARRAASSTTWIATATTSGWRSVTARSRPTTTKNGSRQEPPLGEDRRPHLRGRRRRVVEHPIAQPARRVGDRITEGMTRWSHGELTGAGLSEYLDQVVDGIPVGTSVDI